MKSYYFTEEHELFRQSLRTFLEKEAIPNIDKWEEEQRIPRDIWKKMGEMGFLGLSYPEEYGGMGLDFFYDVVFNEELGRCGSGGFAITQQVVQYMSGPYILKYASDHLKNKYLPGIISGELLSSIGITEPGAGSDVQNIQTKAIREGDYYIVNGSKTFITNGIYGDFIVTVVKTNPAEGAKGVSLLVIEQSMEGVSTRKLKKLGWHASDTAEISFDNVKVPVENLIGQEGRGFYYLMNGLQLERICSLPAGISSMEQAIQKALQYMSERHAFGRSLNKFQVLRHRIAQMASEVEALKSFVYTCARMYSEGIYDVKLCSMAKLLVSEQSEKVATQCLQFYGGYGFMEEYPQARMYRDVRVGTIGGGSSEIMREIISKMIIEDVGYKAAPRTDQNATSTSAANSSNAKWKTEAAATSNGNAASLDTLVAGIQQQAAAAKPLGKTLKFQMGKQQIYIDGTGASNIVSDQNENADCTIDVSMDDFKALIDGQLNPMSAFMSGKIKIKGDMDVAMKLQSLFS
jgi:alkylation response protein AidB-like acyl-CoA dehydrogenase/putative sterol carrier protein